jgi:hypothetical protein
LEAGAVQVTVALASPAVAVPMVGAPGTVAAAAIVVLVSTGGAAYAGAVGDGDVATTTAGYPRAVALSVVPSAVKLAVVSNSLWVQLRSVPPAPEAVRVVVTSGSVSVDPPEISVAPVDPSRYGNDVVPRKPLYTPEVVDGVVYGVAVQPVCPATVQYVIVSGNVVAAPPPDGAYDASPLAVVLT